ncbi:TPA: hypothetical protein QHS11_002805, partial [Enterobacter asburiae]|nr:hypothetical protein [Enterobacter asburiae]
KQLNFDIDVVIGMRKMHADFIGGSMIITLNTSKSTTTSKDKSGSYCAQRDAKVLDFVTPEKSKKVDEDQAIAAILKRAQSLKW